MASVPESTEKAPILRVVLTGGPCAGKTTAMARLSTYLRERGYRVFTVPEAATMLFSNGATFTDLGTPEAETEFQVSLMRTQMHLEDTFFRLARVVGKPAVLLCDRGTMDGSAYVSRAQWERLLELEKTDNVTLRDTRYDAVFHLVTAAKDAEEFYTLETNVTRTETPEQARELDAKLLKAWVGHPRLFVFDNHGVDFEGKLRRLVDSMSSLVGLPSSQRTFHRFLLRSPPDYSTFPVHVERFKVDKVYLVSSSTSTTEFTFVRRRRQGSLASYGQTTARRLPDGRLIETKRIINARDYAYAVLQRADPNRHHVRLRRASFLWCDHYFEIYEYDEPLQGLCLLNCQARSKEDPVPIPPFLDVEKDVTGQPQFSAYTVSLKEYVTGEPTARHLQQLLQDAPKLKRTVTSDDREGGGAGTGDEEEAILGVDAGTLQSPSGEGTQ